MKRYILTGTPGSGKTTIIQALSSLGFPTVSEAATDIITSNQAKGILEPWTKPGFINKIIKVQKQRQATPLEATFAVQFYDRSPICTYALSQYLGLEPTDELLDEIERLEREQIYQNKVFFIENLGFCTPTSARKISFEESLVFEKIHMNVYSKFGHTCIKIAPKTVEERVDTILKLLN